MREMIEWYGHSPLTLILSSQAVLHLPGSAPRRIGCYTGVLWISDAPAGADHVLSAGQSITVSSDVVLSGLPEAVIQIFAHSEV